MIKIDGKPYISVVKAAKKNKISPDWVLKLIRNKEIPNVKKHYCEIYERDVLLIPKDWKYTRRPLGRKRRPYA